MIIKCNSVNSPLGLFQLTQRVNSVPYVIPNVDINLSLTINVVSSWRHAKFDFELARAVGRVLVNVRTKGLETLRI